MFRQWPFLIFTGGQTSILIHFLDYLSVGPMIKRCCTDNLSILRKSPKHCQFLSLLLLISFLDHQWANQVCPLAPKVSMCQQANKISWNIQFITKLASAYGSPIVWYRFHLICLHFDPIPNYHNSEAALDPCL